MVVFFTYTYEKELYYAFRTWNNEELRGSAILKESLLIDIIDYVKNGYESNNKAKNTKKKKS